MVSLTNPNSLGNLWHHGEDPGWQLLMAQIRHPELILFMTCEGHTGHHSHPNTQEATVPSSPPQHIQAPVLQSHNNHANPDTGSRGSHLLVAFSSPGLGSKNVTFLPSPGFFTGVLRKKNGSEHGQALGSVCILSPPIHHTSSHACPCWHLHGADHECRAGSVPRTRKCWFRSAQPSGRIDRVCTGAEGCLTLPRTNIQKCFHKEHRGI